MTPSTAALVSDLIFATKIRSAAKAAGVSVTIVRSVDALAERLKAGSDALIIVDLNADADALGAVRRSRAAAHQPRTIAYASHVQADLIEAARRAGAHEVMARSAFVTRLVALLTSVGGAQLEDRP
jgi:hypothetical protein